MSSSFYPLGMNSYNNRLPQGGYKSSKGTGVFSNPTGVTAGNIRPLTNNDPSNSVPQKFGLPRPIKHYRKGISVTSLDNSTNSRQVKSSTGGGSLIGQMIDIPGGFSIKENPSNETSNTEELDKDCKTCQGVGIISDWQPITDLTEKPEPETQTPQYCCNEERNSLRRLRSANTKLKKNYYTSTTNYLYNRCQTFEQKQFNYLSTGNAATKPGAPLSQDNIYKANCNPNLEIQFTESQLPDGITLTPSNPLGCETVQYHPNNYKYAQQGAVSSSDRLLRLNVETIDTNRANIIKNRENLTKSKYFPNASGSENNSCCIIGSKAVSSFGTTILYITYPLVTRTFRTLTHRFSFPSSFSSISDAPVPVIQNEYILVVPSYELIDPNTNKVKMTLKYQLFTNNDAELLTVGLSFANNVNYYNQNTSIIEIIQFDGMPLYGLGNQFSGLTPEILISAPDEPRIINGTSALNCFKDCPNFNSPGIINWNIANVVNMSGMFQNAPLFNQNLNTWDTSNVTNMSSVFRSATLFDNGQTGAMDISGNPFTGAFYTNSTRLLTSPNSKFLTQLSPSDVLIITAGTPTTPIIYTSQIQSSPILSDVSLVLLTAYGSNISSNQITSIKKQVAGSAPLTWNTSNVTTMNSIFQNATYFNQRVSTWDVSKVTDMGSAFQGFQDSIVYTNILLNVFNNGELAGSNHNLLNNWNTGNATNMSYTFSLTSGFNQYIGSWTTTNVTNIAGMFYNALVFNNGLAAGVGSDTASLNGWNTSNVTTMMSMFQQDAAFNQNVSSWNVSKVTNMNTMFYLASNFNNGDNGNNGAKPLTNWSATLCTSFASMFQQASVFNQNISNWDVSKVINMNATFSGATLFNNGETGTQDISGNPFTGAFYTNSTRLLTSPNSKFRTQLSPSDVLIITAGTPTTPIIYTSQIQTSPIVSDVSLVLLTAYGSNIAAGTITSIKKQVVGTKDMSWNTSILIPDLQYMFSDATYFNQNVSSFTVGNATNMFSSSSTSLRGIFNNGQLAGSNNNSLRYWNTLASGSIGAMFFNSAGFNQNISNWNVSNVVYAGQMFQGALVYNNGLAPGLFNNDSSLNSWNTTKFGDIQVMFNGAVTFNQNISNWNVSKVTTMNATFSGATLFNNGDISGNSIQPLTTWTAPLCTNFATMFQSASSFNQPIPILVDSSGIILDASGNGVSLSSMFQSATRFNQNLNTWNTSKVTIMSAVFSTTSVFNNGDIAGASTKPLTWITDNVTTMASMFTNALVFNQPIDTSGNYWNTGKVTNMFQMLAGGSVTLIFNQPIGKWDVSNVTTMFQMLYGAINFNQDIRLWKTGSVTTMGQMFKNATLFNQTINTDASGSWDVSKVTDMSSMFSGATAFNNGRLVGVNDTSLNWYAPNCRTFASMLTANSFNQPIPSLVDTSGITLDASGNGVSLSAMFQNAQRFNQNLNTWNVSRVTDMSSMFSRTSGSTAFNNGSLINDASNTLTWYAPNCTTFVSMFSNSAVFNQPIPSLVDTSGISLLLGCNLSSMFQTATLFNQNLNTWNVSRVTNMSSMFLRASGTTAFNNGRPLGVNDTSLNWYAPKCTTFALMFSFSLVFNQPIPFLVDTSGISLTSGCTLSQMFQNATVFNQNLNTWNVSKVTIMTNMFLSATAFNNGSLTNDGANELSWNASNCINFTGMFQSATSFNQKVNNLVNTANVIDCSLNSMFQAATIFNNGQIGTMDISGNAPFTYTDSTRLLLSTGSQFRTQLLPTDVLIITAGTPTTTTIYTSQIQTSPIVSDVSLVLLTAYGSNILSGITSIKKQVAGSAPLTWNTTNVKNMSSLFLGAYYFNQNINNWSTSNVTNMSSMFAVGTTALRNMFNNGQLAGSSGASLNWYASNCTNFTSMFAYTSGFNQPTPTLVDTSGVALQTGCTLTSMFQNTTVFNQNISNWNVSRVTNMTNMFNTASAFNNGSATNDGANTLTWNAPNCLFFSAMFSTATAFNQPIPTLVDTSSNLVGVCALNSMFSGATLFNQNLNTWNVSKVTAMNSMFLRTSGTTAFNNGRPLGVNDTSLNWYAPNCTTFASMFFTSTAFNQPMPFLVDTSGISLSTGCNLTSMFQNAAVFNQNLNGWNVSRVINMTLMFSGTIFNNGDISGNSTQPLNWYAPNCNTFSTMFNANTAFNQPMPFLVDTSGNTNPSGCSLIGMFQLATRFNQNLNTWNVSRATIISLTFSGASAFNNGQLLPPNISGTITSATYTVGTSTLYVPGATFIASGFSPNDVLIIATGTIIAPTIIYTSQIQRIISDASLVLLTPYTANILTGITSIKKQVAGTTDLSWNTTNVTNMASMFTNAYYFNQNISNWDVTKVTTMASAFAGASTALKTVFNNGQIAGSSGQPLNWSASLCSEFASMFQNTSGFNQTLSNLVNVFPTTPTTNIPGCILANLSYVTSTSTLTSTNAIFSLAAINGRTLFITTASSIRYVSVATYVGTTSVTLAPNFGSNITSGNFASIYIGPTLALMFLSASVFNQNVNTWNTSNVTNMSSMFSGSTIFNNGQTGTQTVRGTPSLASYASPTLTCPDASFNLDLSLNDVIIITTGGSAIYSSVVATIPTNATLTLSATYPIGTSLLAGVITSIKKQVAGTADLSWNTQSVTTTQSMFQNATYFNQRLPWNMRLNTTVTSMFAGTASFINLFNNGQILTGTTQRLYDASLIPLPNTWDFSNNGVFSGSGTTNWRANSRLITVTGNGITINPVLTSV